VEDLEVLTDGGGREHCLRTTQLAPAPVQVVNSLHQHRTAISVVDPDPHHFGNLDPHPDPYPHQTL
jgi:hypothetical protein